MFIHTYSRVHCTLAEHLMCIQVCAQWLSVLHYFLQGAVYQSPCLHFLPVCVFDVRVHSVCAPPDRMFGGRPVLSGTPCHATVNMSENTLLPWHFTLKFSTPWRVPETSQPLTVRQCCEELGFWSSVFYVPSSRNIHTSNQAQGAGSCC